MIFLSVSFTWKSLLSADIGRVAQIKNFLQHFGLSKNILPIGSAGATCLTVNHMQADARSKDLTLFMVSC
ncbi:hypothetical protein KsCSTR_04880 [Candidatus Kuenenia stuttgartiensis]|uniref:Uncharacterized protein n=1 Tax=Kuenenia stuttgartiensis TaxID=174633 RepID=Q1Q0A5_KUEST|nr:hypothetical protein KsCSTR_04880 [Candidatus Kuenenia stuttgartiensis]CAJ72755.1 unknown protein [Candidatus Kuenenia stuttgartiensis]